MMHLKMRVIPVCSRDHVVWKTCCVVAVATGVAATATAVPMCIATDIFHQPHAVNFCSRKIHYNPGSGASATEKATQNAESQQDTVL